MGTGNNVRANIYLLKSLPGHNALFSKHTPSLYMHICVYTSIYTIAYQYDLWLHLPNLNLVTWRYRLVSSLQKLQNPSIGASKSFSRFCKNSICSWASSVALSASWPRHLRKGMRSHEGRGLLFCCFTNRYWHLAFFHFFSGWSIIGKSSLDDFCSTIFEPLKQSPFWVTGFSQAFFQHQQKLGLFTQLDQGPFQLIDLLTSGCQGPSHHQPNPPKGPWGIGRCCALSCQPFEESSIFYWLHFCNEHHFLVSFYQLHNSKFLITCSGPVLHMPSELGHHCIFCSWRHWWTLTWLTYHNASKWAHPSQKS